jgi:anti-sigma factor RsiW
MKCSKCARFMGLYAGGDLLPPEREEVAGHLASCQACRTELENLRRALLALKEAACTEEMLPGDDASYWSEVEARLRGRTLHVERLSTKGWRWWNSPALLAQAAVVLLVAGAVAWLVMLPQQPVQHISQGPETPFSPRKLPVVVLVRPSAAARQAEVFKLPTEETDVTYSDFNHILRPDEVRRIREQILPAAFDEGTEGKF